MAEELWWERDRGVPPRWLLSVDMGSYPAFGSRNRVGSLSWRFVTTGDCAGGSFLGLVFFDQGVGTPVVLIFRRRRRGARAFYAEHVRVRLKMCP
jgi:hypothetical protein